MVMDMYEIRVDHLAQDIPDIVRSSILEFIKTYEFSYVTSIGNIDTLRVSFIQYFTARHSYEWLKEEAYRLARNEGRKLTGVATVAFTEPNRIHTGVLGRMLLDRGITQCITTHTYGETPMSPICQQNLEDKLLDIEEIIKNTFPPRYDDLKRRDIPMIPQHPNCRHVMAPPPSIDITKPQHTHRT